MNDHISLLHFAATQLRAFLRKGRRRDMVARQRQRLEALSLTPRETTVAQLILQQCSYQDIAERCQLAPRTVQFHASNIFRKAGVSRRREFEQLVNGSEPLPPAARAPAPPATPAADVPPAPIPAPSPPAPTSAPSAVVSDPVAAYPKR